MAFSDNLQHLRARESLTQEQLAERLDVSRQSVSKWESSLSFPEMDTILKLCDLFDVSLDTLLRGDVAAETLADTAGYDKHMNTFTCQVTLSISGILLGVVLMVGTMALGLPEPLATALFLLILTIAVVVLIAGGIQHENFCRRHPTIPDFYPQEEKDAFHQKFVWLIAGGVGAILFGVVAMLLFFSVFPEEEPYELAAVAVFLVIVAGSVGTFIYGGMQEEKYKIWKYNRDNNPTPEAKARLNMIGVICACLMLAATAVYVGLGLTMEMWSTAWWLFPVGGILCGIAAGLVMAEIMGVTSWEAVSKSPWLALPAFSLPEFAWEPLLFIIPVTLAPAIEHFGDIIAISSVTGKDYLRDPGVKNTMLGDGVATMAACLLGGPPNTTYSEVTGAVTLTRAFNPAVMTWAALCAILLSMVAKVGAFLSCIPAPVMGGIMILLFGAIMVVGLNTLVRAGQDLLRPRNMVIVALIIIFGVGGMQVSIGGFKLAGIGLAAITGVVLNLLLPQDDPQG